ncbi:MAG: metalloregulator ArsR/SmtB family transcription factor [Bryobacteraceae bacterium]|nr:metalloregulator ArsR/SmtB family transcription factor [Bryobacteraceae bacterium]
MADILKALRVLGDEGRLRILRLVRSEELNVAELQDILGMGQSRISMQLAQLKHAGLVEVRKAGQKSLYQLSPLLSPVIAKLIEASSTELKEAGADDRALALILNKRKDKIRSYFDELAGRFGRNYVPGRSWKGLAEMLFQLLPPLTIADLGAGEATMSLLLAQRAKHVIAVDSSSKMVEFGAEVARRNAVTNLEYRHGDLEALPIASEEADLALLHQSLHHAIHPKRSVSEAWRILKPGGRVVVMDLLKHRFEEARDMYADVWLGFSQAELADLLQTAGFRDVEVSVVHREEEAPHFETILAIGHKPATLEP